MNCIHEYLYFMAFWANNGSRKMENHRGVKIQNKYLASCYKNTMLFIKRGFK